MSNCGFLFFNFLGQFALVSILRPSFFKGFLQFVVFLVSDYYIGSLLLIFEKRDACVQIWLHCILFNF